jgi:hypothetical protein
MKRHNVASMVFAEAPAWVATAEPAGSNHLPQASLVMLRLPGELHWTVATRTEADAIANPRSFVGDLMRPHAGLLGLWHLSSN